MRIRVALVALSMLALASVDRATLPPLEPAQAEAEGVSAIATGSSSKHSCLITGAGGVKCWGRNDHGQLGDGTRIDRTTPVHVQGLEGSVAAVATGYSHTCALTTGGDVLCWGRATQGQLGDAPECMLFCLSPVNVSALGDNIASITTGYLHSCALNHGGGVQCWGNNFHGQLGGARLGENSSTPVDVGGLSSGVASVAAGDWHTCAVMVSGGLKCWGENLHGQLGDGGSGVNRIAPVTVQGIGSHVTSVAPGAKHTCAVPASGSVKCWGSNGYGQLGNGTSTNSTLPVSVSRLDAGIVALSAGGDHTCGLTSGGNLSCWGRNDQGQVGDGSTVNRNLPAAVAGLNAAAPVGAGERHTCALGGDGDAACWGDNAFGQLGDGYAPVDSSVPVLTFKSAVTKGPENDTDGDGCPDVNEQQTTPGSELRGGLRDYQNPYDFYDVNGDRVIDLPNDFVSVVEHYAPTGAETTYDAALDRGPSAGPYAWSMTAPDGVIDLTNDILGVIRQIGHRCV